VDAIRPYLERPMSRLNASRAAFDLIASFEGYRTRAVKTPDGKWTLGFGHSATAREGLSVTRAQAEDLLRWDLLPIEDTLRQVALMPLTQNQFDALVSFAFNIGLENFKKSDVLKYINQGQPISAALSMHAWRRARVNGRVLTIDALVRRRAAEAALFLEPVGARAAAPTSIVLPEPPQGPEGPERPEVIVSRPLKHEQTLPPIEDEKAPILASEPILARQPEQETKPEPTQGPPRLALQNVRAEVLRQDVAPPPTEIAPPIVAPPMSIAPPIQPATVPPPPSPAAPSRLGPIMPSGIAPFPDGPIYETATPAANNNGDGFAQTSPANDGYNTRLYATPEPVNTPDTDRAVKRPSNPASTAGAEPSNGYVLLTWAAMALGAALLAFGLFYSWKSGFLSVGAPKREPTGGELAAIISAAGGFILLMTSAAAAIAGQRPEAEG
jgi:lysozyme